MKKKVMSCVSSKKADDLGTCFNHSAQRCVITTYVRGRNDLIPKGTCFINKLDGTARMLFYFYEEEDMSLEKMNNMMNFYIIVMPGKQAHALIEGLRLQTDMKNIISPMRQK